LYGADGLDCAAQFFDSKVTITRGRLLDDHPTIFAIMGIGTRAAIIRETALCLKSWKRKAVNPAGIEVIERL
jgi:hypothetical protein